jgi:diacylglycerol kinase family enzyme
MRKNKDKGFTNLKNLTDKKKKVVVVVCGGDGTVMWVVS